MATKKYVSLEKLGLYDEKIKKFIADSDTTTLDSAKAYADGLAKNYDEAGAAAAVQGKLDEEVTRAKAREDEIAGLVATAQKDVDDLEKYVGTIPATATATDVIGYVQEKTAGIATDAALEELSGQVSGLQTTVQDVAKDYLKGADKTELSDLITAEKNRAEGIEGGLRTDVDAIKADYLKGADKTALEDQIAEVAGDVAIISGDYLKAADKKELSDAITAEVDRAKEVEEGLQTQINTIMNNPDTEGVINSINEFTQYIADHGEIAEGFRSGIEANTKAIEDHEALAAQTYETKENATVKYDELEAKIVQADWSVNDPADPAYIKNRPFYADMLPETAVVFEGTVDPEDFVEIPDMEGCYYTNLKLSEPLLPGRRYTVLVNGEIDVEHWSANEYEGNVSIGNNISISCSINSVDASMAIFGTTPESYDLKIILESRSSIILLDKTYSVEELGEYNNVKNGADFLGDCERDQYYRVTVDGVVYEDVKCTNNYYNYLGDDGVHPFKIWFSNPTNTSFYTPGPHSIKVEYVFPDAAGGTIVQLDDMFISDNIARVSEVNIAKTRIGIAEDRLDAIEAQLGGGEGSVTDQIDTAKTEVLEELATTAEDIRIAFANSDAVVLAEAQKGIDAVQAALDIHEEDAVAHITTPERTTWNNALQATDITVGAANGTIAVKGTDVAVKGLGSAAYVATTAFDSAGSAAQSLTDAKAYTDTEIGKFVEASEEEINALFA